MAERVAVCDRRAAHYGAVIRGCGRPRDCRTRRAEVARAPRLRPAERAGRAAPLRRVPGGSQKRCGGLRIYPSGGTSASVKLAERERWRRIASGRHALQRRLAAFNEESTIWQRRSAGRRCRIYSIKNSAIKSICASLTVCYRIYKSVNFKVTLHRRLKILVSRHSAGRLMCTSIPF